MVDKAVHWIYARREKKVIRKQGRKKKTPNFVLDIRWKNFSSRTRALPLCSRSSAIELYNFYTVSLLTKIVRLFTENMYPSLPINLVIKWRFIFIRELISVLFIYLKTSCHRQIKVIWILSLALSNPNQFRSGKYFARWIAGGVILRAQQIYK